jgi:DNA-directed RNA polymerase subunit RPC12/RpoP
MIELKCCKCGKRFAVIFTERVYCPYCGQFQRVTEETK